MAMPFGSYAAFTPAFSDGYCRAVVKETIGDRKLPARLKPADLNLLNPKSKLFHLEWGLYSAGLAVKHKAQWCMVTVPRDARVTRIVGDSGGFQVINGRIEMRHDVFRAWSLQWLEKYCDVGIILDIPTRSIDIPASGFKTFDQCLQQTEENARWALSNRSKSDMKLLTVFQGRDAREANAWFARMRKLQGFDGIAFAGGTKKDLFLACSRLIDLVSAGELPAGAHLHWLGVGQPGFGLLLTGMQRALRKHVDNRITITFDCSTAFSVGGRFKKAVMGVDYGDKAVKFRLHQFPSEPKKIALDRPFPFRSPIGERVTMGDLMPKTDKYEGAWDQSGTLLLINHNVYAQVAGMIEANKVMDLGYGLENLIPWEIRDAVEGMDRIFEGAETDKYLKKHKKSLQFYVAASDGSEDEQR